MIGTFRKILLVTMAMVLALGASACGANNTYSNHGSVMVKALWYSGKGDATQQGTADVTISMGLDESGSDFTLDLDTERAQGAGPAWTAATWSAASVATLFSFRDPKTVGLSVSIDGAIDGPSAGGLMATTMLALSSGFELKQDATMTGTINPDGSIGLVGGIPAKIQAAHDAGMKKVLIPAGGKISVDPRTGDEVNVIKEGERLGIEVIEVSSVIEALANLTGREEELASGSGNTDPISGTVLASIAKSAHTLSKLTQQQIAKAQNLEVAPQVVKQAEQDRRKGAAALRASHPVEAYAQLSQTYYELVSQIAARQTEAVVKRQGSQVARQQLLTKIGNLERLNATKRESNSAVKTTNVQQAVGLPDALTWTTTPSIALPIYRGYLEKQDGKVPLSSVAQRVAAIQADIEVSLTPSIEALLVSGSGSANEQEVSDSLTSYASFLKQTGDASMNYFEQVLAAADGIEDKAELKRNSYRYAAADSMRSQLNEDLALENNDSLQEQRLQLSLAISYYIASAQLVVETEILRISPSDSMDRPLKIGDESGYVNAVKSSAYANGSLLEMLADEQIDSSYAHWGVEWSDWQTSQPAKSGRDETRLQGLFNSWYSSIQLLLLNSVPLQTFETFD